MGRGSTDAAPALGQSERPDIIVAGIRIATRFPSDRRTCREMASGRSGCPAALARQKIPESRLGPFAASAQSLPGTRQDPARMPQLWRPIATRRYSAASTLGVYCA